MSIQYSALRNPIIAGEKSLEDITEDVARPLESRPTGLWWAAFLISATVMMVGVAAVWYQIKVGIGTWGLNRTVDRKSTRLNSSHVKISYAVFCLKKKKNI